MTKPYDLLIIGGGINGCGIARDAAGRGLSVCLAEQGDLAQATSSSSTKLIHGGLRYLEYFEFRLVREALKEREVLLRAMPHIAQPMRFVLPVNTDQRFAVDTPASRALRWVLPKGRRPARLIRLGLVLYDYLGGRHLLPGTKSLDLRRASEGAPLHDHLVRAFEYSDCWVDDARLVVLNAVDAAARGATVLTSTRVVGATRSGKVWSVTLQDSTSGATREVQARALVNAAGPWVGQMIDGLNLRSTDSVRLVQGSHIVVPRLYDHDKAYFLQGSDGRIIFAIPYEQDFTLFGTTEADHPDPDVPPECTPQEQTYLCDFASQYFAKPVTRDQIVWTYSGVRALYDDGAASATAATRDYVLRLDTDGAPVLSVFGGKITTYRRLAESAMAQLGPLLGVTASDWTAGAPLPGGDFAVDGVKELIAALSRDYPFLTPVWAGRLVRAYGTTARDLLGQASTKADLGQDFGATLTEAEVRWLIENEFARCAEDILWRRSKLGLRLSAEQAEALDRFVKAYCQPSPIPAA